MHGNVREWCQDWYGEYPGGIALDPQGPGGSDRVIRGGYWRGLSAYARNCRSAYRYGFSLDNWDSLIGLRVVLAPGQP